MDIDYENGAFGRHFAMLAKGSIDKASPARPLAQRNFPAMMMETRDPVSWLFSRAC
ncbi:hypothetical protein Arad_4572 [Rhizobium rhizogenes K84]|uniref:Uncharacterized protein n=1 Tax=Rhizobium rhizogenes (strain K84 / ATCC BAA-868) TaxID=311403 RepID=B9JDC7_RHIR8|nr:hypothetical protein Arad_4572 [Rhizobium rhizogenes K84]